MSKPKKKSSPILTNKELKSKGEPEKAPLSNTKTPKPSKAIKEAGQKKEAVNPDIKFECGFAPGGKSNVSFVHKYEGIEYNYELNLNNKIFDFPKGLKKEDAKRFRKALIDNDFIDVTRSRKGVVFNKQTGEYIYKAVHPEHSDRNRVQGNIGLVLFGDNGKPMLDALGKQITETVGIENGLVKTDKKEIYESLLKAGFRDAGKEEKRED